MRYGHDSAYVASILETSPSGLSPEEFRRRFRHKIYSGWQAEVNEAERRYFARQINADKSAAVSGY